MTYLVTGAAGFIGSNLCHLLVEAGERVVGIDAMKIGSNLKNLPPFGDSGQFAFFPVDITWSRDVRDILRGFNVSTVIHLAAETHVDRSIASDETFWKTNVLGTARFMDTVRQYGIVRFINQITDEVYGSVENGFAVEGEPFNPTSPYAASKAAQYMVGLSYYKTYGFPVISTFPSKTYGPRQWPEKIIPKFVIKLMQNQKVPLMKSAQNIRDWLAVHDHCYALIDIARAATPGQSFNICGRHELTNSELTGKILRLMDCDESMIEIVPDRAAHDRRYAVDDSKVRAYLKWKPVARFDDYLKMTVEWYRENARTFYHQLFDRPNLDSAA